MAKVAAANIRSKKQKRLEEVNMVMPEEHDEMAVDGKLEMIRALIALGLMHLEEELQREVTALAGERHARDGAPYGNVRYRRNGSSISLAGQRVPVSMSRARNLARNREVSLATFQVARGCTVDANGTLLFRVLHGLSRRNYEEAAEAAPGAIGLSASSAS